MEHHERWVIPDEAVDDPAFRWADRFGLEAPLIVEIGSGWARRRPRSRQRGGTTTYWHSRSGGRGWPTPWPGSRRRGLANVRPCGVDAVWSMEHLVARAACTSCGRSSPTPGTRPGTTSAGWSPHPSRPSRRVASVRGRVAAGHRLGRLRRADGAGARCRAGPRGWRGRSLGRAAGDEVRAQGDCRRLRHRRPAVPTGQPDRPGAARIG